MRTDTEIMADAEDRRVFSNGTEGEIWMGSGHGCYDCQHDDIGVGGDEKYCPILSAMLVGVWPKEIGRETVEWSYPANESWGKPATAGSYEVAGECSEFFRRPDDDDGPDDDDDGPPPDPGPPPVVEGQIDMFEIFAEQIVDAIPDRRPATVS
jgi:hypothetical protein